jgi:hypothetical protein
MVERLGLRYLHRLVILRHGHLPPHTLLPTKRVDDILHEGDEVTVNLYQFRESLQGPELWVRWRLRLSRNYYRIWFEWLQPDTCQGLTRHT